MAPDPDKALNAIRRLAANKVCPNCGHEERMGFKDVCMKYKIFICSDCKSAHQAYSHRCKSVTMSNWTMAEVEVLKHENGGGNAINMAKMFARFPEGAKRPTKGCHPDDLKAFINEAYNDLRWYDENGQVKGEPTPPPAARTVTMQAPSVKPSPSNGGMGMGMGGAMGMPGGGMGGGMGMGGGAMGMASPSTPAAKPAAPPGGAVLQPTMVNPSKSKGEIMNLFG